MSKAIAFIGGGQMAEALIRGLLQSRTWAADQIMVVEPVAQRRQHLTSAYGVQTWTASGELDDRERTLILAVKPQVMAAVLAELAPRYRGELVITIAAGLPLDFYGRFLGEDAPLIRVMPNMGALILHGASALCGNSRASAADLAHAETLLGSVGSVVTVEERLMDAVTGLSGSGPAYVFSFIEALIEGGVKCGLSRPVARELAVQTVAGAALCLKEPGTHPALLRDQVTSPGGTTASGLLRLEAGSFRATVIEAVEAACARSRQLGESR